MFKNIFKSANNEIKASNSLKHSTLKQVLDSDNKFINKNRIGRKHWVFTGFATAGLTLALAIIFSINGTIGPNFTGKEPPNLTDNEHLKPSAVAYALGTPEYPVAIAFDDFDTETSGREEISEDFLSGVRDFSFKSASTILNDIKSKENNIYSPVSLYMALAILAETTEGSTQEEILKVLSMEDMDLLSSETPKLFRSLYTDNEIGKLNLANSLWLSNGYDFKNKTIDKLTSEYYAHSFSVDFSDSSTAKSISDWVSKYTGGNLGTDPETFKATQDQVMSIINTIYFYDQWQNKFDPELTKADDFHLEGGEKVSNDFMNMPGSQQVFAKGDNYTSSSLSFKNDCSMVFVLPDEGVSPYDIINNPDTLEEAINFVGTPKENFGEVTFKIPKFDFSNDLNLNDSLKKLGLEEVYNFSANFSPLTESNDLYVSSVNQSASISIDEIGCEAAAFTQILVCGGLGLATEKVDMILNRPFIFAIRDHSGTPLFIGVINNPNS